MRVRNRPVTLWVAVLIALVAVLVPVATADAAPKRGGPKPPATTGPKALVLYDSSGSWGHLGELYALQAANLVGHFGTYTAKPVQAYAAGEVGSFDTTIYLGSTYDEPLPSSFKSDVLAATKPVLWAGLNIWQLATPEVFAQTFGFTPGFLDPATVTTVRYKGQDLLRSELNAGGILATNIVDPARASVLADAVRSDGTTFPFATRGGNLTYMGEIPFSYTGEGDRVIVLQDLLFDLFGQSTVDRHRALVRLEDISPVSDPAQLRAVADYLSSRGVPFGFGVSPLYVDPSGHYTGGIPERYTLSDTPEVVDALKYMISKGGVLIEHGYSHQYGELANPYNGVSGDDYEFYRVVENPDHSLTYVGPVAEDSERWVQGRIDASNREFKAVGLTPTIFEFPHYAGSDISYKTVAKNFTTRYERGLYYGGTLSGQPVDHSKMVGQFFPYVVKDVYGTKVLPENLGDVSPDPWFQYPSRLPVDLVDAARRNLAVRDGFASFFFHPYLDINYLKQSVEGIQALGYTFVSPASL